MPHLDSPAHPGESATDLWSVARELVDTTGTPYGYTGGNPLQHTDPLGLDWIQDAGDWSAAFGDKLTLGGTRWSRQKLGVDGSVNYCSTFYSWGGVGGNIASLAPIGAGAFGAARVTSWGARKAPVLAAAINRAVGSVKSAVTQATGTIRQRLSQLNWADDAGHITLGPGSLPPPPRVSAGASLENIAVREAVRIQNAADRINRPIHLVGSRARREATAKSDWDYIVTGITSKIRHQLVGTLPRGPRELGVHGKIYILKTMLDETQPHRTFFPSGW